MVSSSLDVAFAKAYSRRMGAAVSRLDRYRERVREQWNTLTPVQKRTIEKLLLRGKSLSVPEEVRRVTARALVRKGLCMTYATGEYAVDGPYVSLTINAE